MANYLTLEQFAKQLGQITWPGLSMPWCIRGLYHVTYPSLMQQDSEAVGSEDNWNHIDFSENGRGTVADLIELIKPYVKHNPKAAVTVNNKPLARVVPGVQPCYQELKLAETTFNLRMPTAELSSVVRTLNFFFLGTTWDTVDLVILDQLAESSGLTPTDEIFWDGGKWFTRQGLDPCPGQIRAKYIDKWREPNIELLQKVPLAHVTVYH
jgi:hypothetical protein